LTGIDEDMLVHINAFELGAKFTETLHTESAVTVSEGGEKHTPVIGDGFAGMGLRNWTFLMQV